VFGMNEALCLVEWVSSIGRLNFKLVPYGPSSVCFGAKQGQHAEVRHLLCRSSDCIVG
jgi:hypothetical protein